MSWVAIGTLCEELEDGPFEVPHPARSKAEAMINVAPAMSSFPMGILVESIARFHFTGLEACEAPGDLLGVLLRGLRDRCSYLGSSSLRMPRRGPGTSVSLKDRPIVTARIPNLGLDELWPAHESSNRNLVYFHDHE